MVNNYTSLFNCTPVGRASDSMMAPTLSYIIYLVGAGNISSVAWPTGIQLVILFCVRFSVLLFDFQGISSCRATLGSVEFKSGNIDYSATTRVKFYFCLPVCLFACLFVCLSFFLSFFLFWNYLFIINFMTHTFIAVQICIPFKAG